MHLSDYLKPKEGEPIPASVLARRMGVSHSTILRLADGKMRASANMLARLRDATDGQVTPNDMIGAAHEQASAA